MPTEADKKFYAAVNEFIADYVERHGENQATRDEAHAEVARLEDTAVAAVAFARMIVKPDWVRNAAEELYTPKSDDAARVYLAAVGKAMEA